mgnify:CR=1 FL=1
MMTKTELNQMLCAVLTTLDEVEYAPESSIYLALEIDLGKFDEVKNMLTSAGLVKSYGNAMSITPAGRAMVVQINEFSARIRAEQAVTA